MASSQNSRIRFDPTVRREVLADRIVLLSPLHAVSAPLRIFGEVHRRIESGEGLAHFSSSTERKVAHAYLRKLRTTGMLSSRGEPEIELIPWCERRRVLIEPKHTRKPVVVFHSRETTLGSRRQFEAAALETLAVRRPDPGTIEFFHLQAGKVTLRPLLASRLETDLERRYLLQALDLVRPAANTPQLPLVVLGETDCPDAPCMAGLSFREMAEDMVFGYAVRGDACLAQLDESLSFETPVKSVAEEALMTGSRSQHLAALLPPSRHGELHLDHDAKGVWRATLDGVTFLSLIPQRACFGAAALAILKHYNAKICTQSIRIHARPSWWLTPRALDTIIMRWRRVTSTSIPELTRKETLFGNRYYPA